MCDKHSFVLTKQNEIFHGYGFIDSHTQICYFHQLHEDILNKYEYNPAYITCAYGINHLKVISQVFTPKSHHLQTIENYINTAFPDWKSFDDYSYFKNLCLSNAEQILKLIGYSHFLPKFIDEILNGLDKTSQLKAVSINPSLVKYILNPDKDLMELAVSKNPHLLEFFIKLDLNSIKQCIEHGSNTSHIAKFINQLDKETQLLAINNDPQVIKLINNPDKELQIAAILKDSNLLEYLYSQDKEITQMGLVINNPAEINSIGDINLNLVLLAIQKGYLKKWLRKSVNSHC